MLFQLIFVVLFPLALADNVKEYYEVSSAESVNVLFESFLQEHGKNYVGSEKIRRLRIFNETLAEINRLNDAHPLTVYGVTFFADLTVEEMESYRGYLTPLGIGACSDLGDPQTHDAPAALDWRQQGAVTAVKLQARCGSCWAFSATATIESRHAAASGQQLDLSEQQLVDCDELSNGCDGGHAIKAFTTLIMEGGQEQESDYPYQAATGTCQFDSSRVAVKVGSCSFSTLSNEDALKELLFKEGPLSIAIAANLTSVYNYKGEIFHDCVHNVLDHAVQLVGYGTENGEDFWIIKNSWGTAWGENGFLRMQRGVNCLSLISSGVASVALA